MKKIIVLILVAFTFFSCGEDLVFKTPSFQGKKDGNLWEANNFSANVDGQGILTIVGSNNFETITIQVSSTAIGIYDVTESVSTSGALLDIDDVFYSSNNTPDPSVQLYPASGIINLQEVNTERGYVSGEFYFNAFNSSGLTSVNVNKGVFFKVPLVSLTATGGTEESCTIATTVADAALASYNATSPGDADFATICNAYKAALTVKKEACGDDDGSIQTIIDGLTCT